MTYGTIKEDHERTFLDNRFRKVICPNRDMGGGYMTSEGIDHLLNMISACDSIVVSEYQGFVGKGVYAEVCRAVGEGKEVQVLRKVNGELKLLRFRKLVLNDDSDWKEKYGIVYVKSIKDKKQ